VSFAGQLETLDLSALLQTLGASGASGRLTLTRLDRHAVIVLRGGRVVYAAGGVREEPLVGRLLREGLVEEAELTAALEQQHEGGRFRPLGEVLAERGLLAKGTLDAVVRRRLEELVGELMSWEGGFFHFEPDAEGSRSDLEVDLSDFLVPDGVAPAELLMKAVTHLERRRTEEPSLHDTVPLGGPPSEPAPPPSEPPPSRPGPAPTLSDSGAYTADFSGEVVLLLLRFASQILTRAVVFAVEGDSLQGVGEFGIQIPGHSAADVVGETVLSLQKPSFLREAVETRRPHVGPLEPTHTNLKMVKRLGGILPREAVAVPLVARDSVRLVLYGDNGAQGPPIGPLDVLEGAADRASRILERTLAARERKQDPPS
jgi:hypothetical protein